jgi:predicted DNA-binding transcriptional regulator AlpA
MPDKTPIDIAALPDQARVRLPTVLQTFAVSESTITRWVRAGLLPAPVKTGNVIAWKAGDLKKVLAQ